MRRLCLGLILLVAIVAAIVSNRDKPMAIAPHASGQWAFEKADYRACVTVRPGPIQRPDNYSVHRYDRRPDSA